MKIVVGLLLFANLALGLWNYTHGAVPHPLPRPIHPGRLRVVSRPAAAATAGTPKVAPVPPSAPLRAVPAPPGASRPRAASPLKKAAFTTPGRTIPATPARQCWELGPVRRRASAAALLRRSGVRGRVVSHPGPPAYRVYVPAGPPWPSAGALRGLGVAGAYVTHGPAGGEVLSLGVFLQKKAALQELQVLQAHRVAARMGPFGAPPRYYAEIRLPAASRGPFKKLTGIGYRRCAGGP